MQVEHSITVQASPQRIFRIYENVAAWHTWDPDTRRAALDGPFAVGTRGTLTPTRGNTVPMVVTHADPDTGFTVESRIPLLLRMVFEHELQPLEGGSSTRVIHRVTFSGALAFVIGRIVGAQVDKGLPVTLANLKALAEADRPA